VLNGIIFISGCFFEWSGPQGHGYGNDSRVKENSKNLVQIPVGRLVFGCWGCEDGGWLVNGLGSITECLQSIISLEMPPAKGPGRFFVTLCDKELSIMPSWGYVSRFRDTESSRVASGLQGVPVPTFNSDSGLFLTGFRTRCR
jgi:hypothetical protein